MNLDLKNFRTALLDLDWFVGLDLEKYWDYLTGFGLIFQEIFQRRFNVAFRLIWRRDVAQRQINVETTLCTSTLKFTTFNNVETTLCISTSNWTMLGNVKTTCTWTSVFTTLGNVETTLPIRPFHKKIKPRFKSKLIFLSFNEYAGLKIFFSFSPF